MQPQYASEWEVGRQGGREAGREGGREGGRYIGREEKKKAPFVVSECRLVSAVS